MPSFYYYYQNPSGFCFLMQIRVICHLNLKERKNEMNSGPSSKKT